MRTHTRIEITAFRRRVQIIKGGSAFDRPADEEDWQEDGDDLAINAMPDKEMIEPQSPKGRRILSEAVSLLQRRLSGSDPGEKQ